MQTIRFSQSIDSIETYLFGAIKEIMHKKRIKCINIIKQYKND